MILEQLEITNFRVFKGNHLFDLAPRQKEGHKPTIILFGGLNGAGKTTTLTAIRLALYGRQSLGVGTSQKDYNQFLIDSVHKSKATGIQANHATVELTFNYANLGVIKHYHVKRSWTVNGNKVSECLKISQDNELISNLSYEQAQGFLNELIPIGVSDLFFFDGEKISELAEDKEGNILGDSVKKLIGLDLIEKLLGDLTVFVRQQNKHQLPGTIKKEIISLEALLADKETLIEQERVKFGNVKNELAELQQKIGQLTNNLNAAGGSWAATREKELENLATLSAERNTLQGQVRESLAGSSPFSIAPNFVTQCLNQLEHESDLKRKKNTSELLNRHLLSLEKRLTQSLDSNVFQSVKKEIDAEFSELTNPINTPLIHDVSDTLHRKIDAVAKEAIENQGKVISSLADKLATINQQIDSAGINIARAPEEDLLAKKLAMLNEVQDKKVVLVSSSLLHKENIKRYLREAMDIVRSLDKLHASYIETDDNNRALEYALKAKVSLAEFAKKVSIAKIKDVEKEFIHSFKRLARKEAISIKAKIEPANFAVNIYDEFSNEISKDNLSAGEKQIYAIAILEALAKTSGRKLPIIIDTPLGRLDSKHRRKLVENYFPTASHQVIILSTDTEIDKNSLSSLRDHISHTVTLDYKETLGSSNVDDGYFWPTAEAV